MFQIKPVVQIFLVKYLVSIFMAGLGILSDVLCYKPIPIILKYI